MKFKIIVEEKWNCLPLKIEFVKIDAKELKTLWLVWCKGGKIVIK